MDNTDKPLTQSIARWGFGGSIVAESHSYTYTYDNFDRVKDISLHRGDSTINICHNQYNRIGQLYATKYGNNNRIDYAYNTCGALRYEAAKKSDGTLTFLQVLRYTNCDTPSYSGNIGATQWHGADGLTRYYKYTYDGLNRLTTATYSESGNRPENVSTSGTRSYGAQYTYGADSRPLAIRRNGVTSVAVTDAATHLDFGVIDNLTFTYSGSHLVKVSDSADDVIYTGATDFNDGADCGVEYTYDANGNMISDANKNITSIEYNALNLPAKVTFADGSSLTNIYSADGTLLRRSKWIPVRFPHIGLLSLDGPVTQLRDIYTVDDHVGVFTYRDGTLARIETPNGFISGDEIYYYIKDYQGNIRQVTDADGNVYQDNHYYPYGMLMAESSDILAANRSSSLAIASFNPYLYSAKEYLPFKGANILDFTARNYDNTTITFTSPDPKRGDYTHLHSQLYCAGNPVIYTDPTGKDIAILILQEGDIVGHIALLIQNNNGKWQYYSINGDNVFISGKFSGGRPFNDVNVGEWNSVQEFLDSPYNTSKGKEGKVDKSINNYQYNTAFVIETNKEQDESIRKKFIKISKEETYNLLNNNCATSVQKSMEAGGLKLPVGTFNNTSPQFGGYNFQSFKYFQRPDDAFKAIKNYFNGKIYKITKQQDEKDSSKE